MASSQKDLSYWVFKYEKINLIFRKKDVSVDGELMIWNGSNRRLESVIVHKICITSLTFNMDGTRLLSADQVILKTRENTKRDNF
jgi:hypothetical protein